MRADALLPAHANSSASAPCASDSSARVNEIGDAPPARARNAICSTSPPTLPRIRTGTEEPSARSASSPPLTTKPPEPSPNSCHERGRDSGVERNAAPSSLTSRRIGWLSPKELLLERHARAKAATQAALRQRDRQTALSDVVGACERAGAHRLADGRLSFGHRVDVDPGQPVRQLRTPQLGQLARVQRGREWPDERDRVARAREARPARRAHVGQLADHADHRRGIDRTGGGALVIERHIAAHDRSLQARDKRRQGRAQPQSAARRCAASRGCRS